MRGIFLIIIFILVLGVGYVVCTTLSGHQSILKTSMTLSSTAFSNNAEIPIPYSCDGDGRRPELAISGAPAQTKSFAIIVSDPDAPSGEFVHWVIWNIPSASTIIPEGMPPEGSTQGQNSAGQSDWISPCPPSGTHHYVFVVYALDKNIMLPQSTNKQELLQSMDGHIISSAQLVGLYSRKG